MPRTPDGVPQRRDNVIWLGANKGLRVVAGLAIQIMLMRGLGTDGYGVYAYVATVITLFGFGAGLGLRKLLVVEISRDPESLERRVAGGLVTVAMSSALTAVGIVVWCALVDGRPIVIASAAIGAVALGLESIQTVLASGFHAVRRMGSTVKANVFGKLALVGVTALLLWVGADVISVFAARVVDTLLTLAMVAFVFRAQLGRLRLRVPPREAARLAKDSVPFGLQSLFDTIYLSVDVILIEHICGDGEVGIYRAAAVIISLLPLVAETIHLGLYPKMAKNLGDPRSAGRDLRFAARILLAISVPAAVGGFLLAEPLIVLLGGAEYGAAAVPFMIMAPLLPLRYLNNGYGMVLSSLNRQGVRTRGVMYAAVFNLLTNLVAIPIWGASGAAATTLLTEILLVSWQRWQVSPLVSEVGLGQLLVRALVPAVVMALVLVSLPSMHVMIMVAIGGATYALVGRLTGAWHPSDIRKLRRV